MTGRPAVLLLGIAQLLMFGCSSLLQVAPGRFFVPLLLAMHAGMLLLAKLKRSVAGEHPEITGIARATYLVMALHIPLLIYKLLDRMGLLQVHYPVLHGATLGLSVLAVLMMGHSLRTMVIRTER